MKKACINKKMLVLLGGLFIVTIAIVFALLRHGTSVMAAISNTIPPIQSANYTLPDVWYGDVGLGFRVSLPPGFVAERVEQTDPYYVSELVVRTKSDWDIVKKSGSETGAWRPAITFEMHTYSGKKTTPLQWAKANLADVPNSPQTISIDGRPGIKYSQNINGDKMTVYVFNQSTGNNPYEVGVIAVIATGSVSDAQLNAVIKSFKFIE